MSHVQPANNTDNARITTTCSTTAALPTFMPPTHSLSATLHANQEAKSHSNSKSKSKSKCKRNSKQSSMTMMMTNKYSYFNPKPQNKRIGSSSSSSAVYLICDDWSAAQCDKLVADKHKYSVFWQLLQAYKLNNAQLFGDKLQCMAALPASKHDLLSYHDQNYVDLLERVEDYPAYSEQSQEEKQVLLEYGLLDDCPIFDGVYEYSLCVAGASLQCAQLIKQEKTRIAINFLGGRHHAFSSKATGHCYVNDIVLCIDSLRNDEQHRFDRVLYIDLDLHHGDAVQEAYYHSNQVFVVSIHHKDIDFFPQSGDKNEYGDKQALFYNLNVPISNAVKLRDDAFCDLVSKICHRLNYFFQPDCVVVCCGCDGLQSDPNRKWSLSINGLCRAVNIIVTQMDKPSILLGGGGYNAVDTAKCWTKIVAQTAMINITNDIPYHDNFKLYAPHYLLSKLSVNATAIHNHRETENENEEKKKQQRANLQALQLIYAHLNNFERFFVQKNLKTQSTNHKGSSHSNANRAKKHKNNSKHAHRNRGRSRVETSLQTDIDHKRKHIEEENKDKEDPEDVDRSRHQHANSGNHANDEEHNHGNPADEQVEEEDIDLAVDPENEREIASDSKKRLIKSVTTNTCRSRRKRRKI